MCALRVVRACKMHGLQAESKRASDTVVHCIRNILLRIHSRSLHTTRRIYPTVMELVKKSLGLGQSLEISYENLRNRLRSESGTQNFLNVVAQEKVRSSCHVQAETLGIS